MNTVDFKKFAEEFFLFANTDGCVYQFRAEHALNLWVTTSGEMGFTLVGNPLDMCMDVLIKKGTEYSTDDDKLYNFKKAAQISGETPVHCAEMFQLKHTTSIQDILDFRLIPTQEMLQEKFVDYINYCVLIAALKHEEKSLTINNQPTT
jgi:hypothetical protein